ncbi:hypothetical protein AB4225_34220 [Streptomyces sp. 2RAF24]|uniref:hypothetical protein n=1 Tax=Streptomyces sp. 2RAF24 TaxID=3232997 RepID=UPI003F9ACE4A
MSSPAPAGQGHLTGVAPPQAGPVVINVYDANSNQSIRGDYAFPCLPPVTDTCAAAGFT